MNEPRRGAFQWKLLIQSRTIFSCMWPSCTKNYDSLEDIERHVRAHLGPKQYEAIGDEDFYYEETEVDEATYLAIFNSRTSHHLPLSPSHNSDGLSSGQSFASSSPATSPVCSTDSSSSSSSSSSASSSSSTSSYPSSQLYANSIDWNHFLADQNQLLRASSAAGKWLPSGLAKQAPGKQTSVNNTGNSNSNANNHLHQVYHSHHQLQAAAAAATTCRPNHLLNHHNHHLHHHHHHQGGKAKCAGSPAAAATARKNRPSLKRLAIMSDTGDGQAYHHHHHHQQHHHQFNNKHKSAAVAAAAKSNSNHRNNNNNNLHLSDKQLNHLTHQLAAAIGTYQANSSAASPSPPPQLSDHQQHQLKVDSSLQFSVQLDCNSPVPSSSSSRSAAAALAAAAGGNHALYERPRSPAGHLRAAGSRQTHDHTYSSPPTASAKCSSLAAPKSPIKQLDLTTTTITTPPPPPLLMPKRGPGRRPKHLQLQLQLADQYHAKAAAATSGQREQLLAITGNGKSGISNNNHLKHNLSQQFFHNQSTFSQQTTCKTSTTTKNNNNNHNNNMLNSNISSHINGSTGNNNNQRNNSNANNFKLTPNKKNTGGGVLSVSPSSVLMSPSPSQLSNGELRRGRGENRKCRKVYGMDRRDMWCTQCKWKKACSRFGEQ